jgi:hypothetical protein
MESGKTQWAKLTCRTKVIMSSKDKQHHILPLLADLIGRGDGTFILKPRLPEGDLDTWITVGEAAKILRDIDRRTIHYWLGEYLVYCRPMPRKSKVSLKSVLALKRATQDAEFWDNGELQRRVKEQVKLSMTKLAEGATAKDGDHSEPSGPKERGQP